MAYINTQDIAERTSFFKLFKNSNLGISVPIIQRDYAHGRPHKKEVRDGFLNALFNYLEEGKPNRDLDFIYGSIINGEINKFTPLDGQQRLTTLFLLHWYLAVRSNNIEEFRDVMFYQNQSRFTYETRTSSKEFCDVLLTATIDLDSLLKADVNKTNSLSKTIKNNAWYFSSWDYDLTIQSMLVMLDAIHAKFNNHPQFYDRLVDENEPIITFLFLNLKKFALTDDLYLKMNARGKALTDFENFKAKFEQNIATINNQDVFTIEHQKDLKRKVSMKEYFSYNIDTKWADFFWKYRNKKTNSFDIEILNFVRLIFTYEYALQTNTEKDKNLEFLIGSATGRKLDNYTDKFTFSVFKKLNSISGEGVLNLITTLDVLSNENKEEVTPNSFKLDEILNVILSNKVSLKQRLLFYAYVEFLKQENLNIKELSNWMRVVFNLVENREFDSSFDFVKGLKEIKLLLANCNNFIEFLKSSTTDINFYAGTQVFEEKVKAYLIDKSNLWETSIVNIEAHPYFKGQISFVLEFSGILKYFEGNNNCNWSKEEDAIYFEKFNFYKEKAIAIFSFFNSEENKNHKLERAVLSKGDYLVNASNNRKNFLSTSRNIRDYSWKRLLRYNKTEYASQRAFVKRLLDDELLNAIDVSKSLSLIIEKELSLTENLGWRRYFIQNPILISYCQQGFIAKNGDNIILYNASQRNHKHREMYVYDYYLNNIQELNVEPFKWTWVSEEKGSVEKSFIVLGAYILNNIEYHLSISFSGESSKITFYAIDKINFEYPEVLKNTLETSLFEMQNIDNFNKWEKSFDKSTLLVELTKLFNQL